MVRDESQVWPAVPRVVDATDDRYEDGCDEHRPNDLSYRVAAIELEDSGRFKEDRQLGAACDCIGRVRRENPNGAVVVAFVHGWHSGASWDDAYFESFRAVLKALALREAERYGADAAGSSRGRGMVGVYFGWNGDPEGWQLESPLRHLSFYDRYRTARRIGRRGLFTRAVRAIVEATKAPLPPSEAGLEEEQADSPLIFIGHSMGALMMESALEALLREPGQPLAQRSAGRRRVAEVSLAGEAVAFPDLFLAVNSAAHSKIARRILRSFERLELRKRIVEPRPAGAPEVHGHTPPVLISMTSVADQDTRRTWRLAQGPLVWRRTDGHDSRLFTHELELEKSGVRCEPNRAPDFGEFWHCLRPPTPAAGPTPCIPVDLPVGESRGAHDRYRLRPRGGGSAGAPLGWFFQVPKELIADHGDLFNPAARLLMLALMQISGTVLSLAPSWWESFEELEN